MNMKRRLSLDPIFPPHQTNEMRGKDGGGMPPADTVVPVPRPAPSSNPRHLINQEEGNVGTESDLSERLARIERLLERLVRPNPSDTKFDRETPSQRRDPGEAGKRTSTKARFLSEDLDRTRSPRPQPQIRDRPHRGGGGWLNRV